MNLTDRLYKTFKGQEPTKVSPRVKNKRLFKCKTCPIYTKLGTCGNGVTKGCGCIVDMKTDYLNEKCPEGKW